MNPIYMQLSDNPLKDFGSKLDVTWKADELLRIAAVRFYYFIKFYHAAMFEKEFCHYRFERPQHVREFWQRLMSEQVRNRFNVAEEPMAMILRHTQLLPRQLLLILNTVAVKNHRLRGATGFQRFESAAICEGLAEAQGTICQEIFNAYRSTYPSAEDICKRCLPFLPVRFRNGDLHAVYNRHGKAIPYATDFEDFRSILVGIGALGKVTNETERYIEADFLYSSDGHLNIQGNELLCIHPVFSRVFSQGSNYEEYEPKVVYPHPMEQLRS